MSIMNTIKTEIPNVNSVSRISAGTTIKGEMNSEYDIRIDGTFEGKIFSKGRVVVGDQAMVNGTITCNNVDLWGKLEGGVIVKDVLVLKNGCSLKGDIKTSKLEVEIGAVLNGTCATITPAEYEKIAGVKTTVKAAAAPAAAPAKEEKTIFE